MKEVNSDWYERNKVKMGALSRAWVAKNPELAKAQRRKGHLKKTYNLTPEDIEQRRQEQGDKCAGCGTSFDGVTPHVDHDHKTGKVRALLCGPCNRTIGMALESPERLMALAQYLQSQNERQL